MIERKDSLETAALRRGFPAGGSRSAAGAFPALDRHVLARAARAPPGRFLSVDDPPRARIRHVGAEQWGAYRFAWGFGFFQFLFEFGASSALQRQISEAWTRGDHDARRPLDRLRDDVLHGRGRPSNGGPPGSRLLGAAR